MTSGADSTVPPFGVGRAPRAWPSVAHATVLGALDGVAPCSSDASLLGPIVRARLDAGMAAEVTYRAGSELGPWVEEWTRVEGDERVVVVRPAAAESPDDARSAWLGALRHDLSNQQFLLRTSLASVQAEALPLSLADVRSDIEHIVEHCTGTLHTLAALAGGRREPALVDVSEFAQRNAALLRRIADPHAVTISAKEASPALVEIEALRAALVMLVSVASIVSPEEHRIELVADAGGVSITLAPGPADLSRRADVEVASAYRALHGYAARLGASVCVEGSAAAGVARMALRLASRS